MKSLYTSRDEGIFPLAEMLITEEMEQPMLTIRPDGSWRVRDYDWDTCEMERWMSANIYHWFFGEWKRA